MNFLSAPSDYIPTETVYLIRNGDLHKIGITSDFDRRMRELAPDHVQARLDLDGTENSTAADIERMLHARFRDSRLPQSEYFRLSNEDVLECCNLMKSFSDQWNEPLDYTVVEEETTPEQEVGIDYFNRCIAEIEAEHEAASTEEQHRLVQLRLQVLEHEYEAWKQAHFVS